MLNVISYSFLFYFTLQHLVEINVVPYNLLVWRGKEPGTSWEEKVAVR